MQCVYRQQTWSYWQMEKPRRTDWLIWYRWRHLWWKCNQGDPILENHRVAPCWLRHSLVSKMLHWLRDTCGEVWAHFWKDGFTWVDGQYQSRTFISFMGWVLKQMVVLQVKQKLMVWQVPYLCWCSRRSWTCYGGYRSSAHFRGCFIHSNVVLSPTQTRTLYGSYWTHTT